MIGDDCTLSLSSNKLVFSGEPKGINNRTGKAIDFTTAELNVIDAITFCTLQVVRTATRTKGSVRGTYIDLSGLPDGHYNSQLRLTNPKWTTAGMTMQGKGGIYTTKLGLI